MSKHYKYNKEYQEPQYYKKRKSSEQDDDRYYNYSDTSMTFSEYHEIPRDNKVTYRGCCDIPKDTAMTFSEYHEIPKDRHFSHREYHEAPKDYVFNYNKHKDRNKSVSFKKIPEERSVTFKNGYDSPKEIRRRDKYKTYESGDECEYEYDEYYRSYDDDYYPYDHYQYYPTKCKDRMNRKYSSESDVYQVTPVQVRRLTRSETETMIEDDSNSDFSLWDPPKEKRGQARDKNRHSRGMLDTERAAYRSDISIYAAPEIRSQNPYRYKRKEVIPSDETASYSETQGYSASSVSKSQIRQHINKTRETPKNTAFSKERVISVIDYNQYAPTGKQKNVTNTDINGSEYVYVPVIIRDKPTPEVKNPSEIKLEKPKEELTFQHHTGVFFADTFNEPSIFEQKNNTSNSKQNEESPNASKQKSKISTAIRKLTRRSNKSEVNVNDYPVKKSYINVASQDKSMSNVNRSESRKNKFSIATLKKKSKQSKENNKKVEENSHKTQDSSKAMNEGSTALSGSKNQTTTSSQQKSGILKQPKKNQGKENDSMRPNQTSTTLNDGNDDMSTTVIYDRKTQSGGTANSKNQLSSAKSKGNDSSATRRCDISRSDSQRSIVGGGAPSPKQKSASRQASENTEVPDKSNHTKKSTQSSKSGKSKDNRSLQEGGPTESKDTGDPVQLWGYDTTPLVYAFQTAQFFLGLTMHDKLMEIANQYYTD